MGCRSARRPVWAGSGQHQLVLWAAGVGRPLCSDDFHHVRRQRVSWEQAVLQVANIAARVSGQGPWAKPISPAGHLQRSPGVHVVRSVASLKSSAALPDGLGLRSPALFWLHVPGVKVCA